MKNRPAIFNAQKSSLEEIKKQCEVVRVIDSYKEQLEDLFLIRNPRFRFDKSYKVDFDSFVLGHSGGRDLGLCGNWVFFPWNGYLVHFLVDLEHQEVRTARNRNLITAEEQQKFYNFKVGVAGLSVGSHGALTLAIMGGCKHLRLADPDTISPSNLNRMSFDFTEIGLNKAEVVAQYIYQLNPYADIELFLDGVTHENIESFVDGLDLVVEELDDIEFKVKVREEAKKRKIPVLMATDNGDGVILDMERFDLHPQDPIFGGSLEGFDIQEIKRSPAKMFQAMAKIIDISLVPPRVINSVVEVGKTIYSWPQLVSAATLSGVVIAYLVRRIALGQPVKEGKYEVNLDEILDPEYQANAPIRQKEVEKFSKALGL